MSVNDFYFVSAETKQKTTYFPVSSTYTHNLNQFERIQFHINSDEMALPNVLLKSYQMGPMGEKRESESERESARESGGEKRKIENRDNELICRCTGYR